MGKLLGLLIVVGVGYAAYHFLFGKGWLATSACLFVWFLLASLYRPGAAQIRADDNSEQSM